MFAIALLVSVASFVCNNEQSPFKASSMSPEDMQAKQKLLKAKSRNLEMQNKRLCERRILMEKSVELNETETGDVDALVKERIPQIAKEFPNSSAFHRIFWGRAVKIQ